MGDYNPVHKFVLLLQAMKILDAQAAVDKEWEKIEKLPACQSMTKVENKKDFSGSTKRAKNSPFCHADGHLSSQGRGVGTEVSKVQRPVCAPR